MNESDLKEERQTAFVFGCLGAALVAVGQICIGSQGGDALPNFLTVVFYSEWYK
jgi:hypothetical protein